MGLSSTDCPDPGGILTLVCLQQLLEVALVHLFWYRIEDRVSVNHAGLYVVAPFSDQMKLRSR
jgi:hypothetical protein